MATSLSINPARVDFVTLRLFSAVAGESRMDRFRSASNVVAMHVFAFRTGEA